MSIQKILIMGGIGFVAYLLYKKSFNSENASQPSPFKKIATDIGHSIIKPLDEVAADVPAVNS